MDTREILGLLIAAAGIGVSVQALLGLVRHRTGQLRTVGGVLLGTGFLIAGANLAFGPDSDLLTLVAIGVAGAGLLVLARAHGRRSSEG